MAPTASHVVIGQVLQTPTPHNLEAADVAIAIDGAGVIVAVETTGSIAAARLINSADQVTRLGPHQRLLPGLIDLHLHAPQWPQLGTGLDLPLEQWLFEYTFPLEARYGDVSFAQAVWDHMVPTLLAHGTTTAVYYATVHESATASLAETCLAHGQRAFVGRVAMDHPDGTPEYYRDADADTGLASSRRSIDTIRTLAGPPALVQPIITPRFVPACTDELLRGLGRLADESGALVQTHCSESDWAHQHVLDRYGHTDTVALEGFGLARDHSVLAHCNHLTDRDLETFARVGAAVAHCPLSNAYFANAVFPVRRTLERGVRMGLGTDVSGGAHPGLLPQAATAVTASRLLNDGVSPALPTLQRGVADSRIDTVTAFWLATMGGATSLGLAAGLLEPGRVFDAFVVELDQPHSPLRRWEFDDEARIFEKVVRLATSADISEVWVQGRHVSGVDRAVPYNS
jgi:guanine deaminase